MMEQTIKADFAIKAKNPGDAQDYRVLTSGQCFLTEKRFERVFYDFSVGQMPEEHSAPGEEPPWITLGPITDAGQCYIAIVCQEWTEQRDHVGRRIKLSRCICMRYRDLAASKATVADISNRLPPSHELLKHKKQSLNLSFVSSTERYQNLSHVIDETGYEFIAAVAALVITRPVALVGAGDLTVTQRLDYLDAILSLLPYGSRAAISVSTWMKSSVEHAIRLGFSNSVRRDQEPVQWKSKPEITPGNPAYEYYVTLCDLRHNYDTLQIVTWLAKQDNMLALNQTKHFCELLRKLNLPYVILRGVQQNRGNAQDVQSLFTSGAAKHLKPDEQHTLLVWLLEQPVAENLAVVEKHWHEDLTSDLCRVIQSLIAQSMRDQEATLTRLYALAYRVVPKHDHRMRQVFQHNPQLHYVFALHAVERHKDAQKELEWLESQMPQAGSDLTIFRIALNLLNADAHLDMLTPLTQANVGYVRRLFKVALAPGTRGVDRLAPVMVGWLLQQVTTLAQTERESWVTLLRSIQSVQQPDLQARIDLLILTFETDSAIPPQFLEGRLSDTPQQFYAYSQALDAALRTLPPQPQDKVVVGLVDILRRLSRYKPDNMLTLGNTLWPYTRNMQTVTSLCKHMFALFKKHTQLHQDEENIREWGQRLSEVGMIGESFELQSWQLSHSTSLLEIVQRCADNLCKHGAEGDPIIHEIKKILQTRSLDFMNFIDLLLEELRKRNMPDHDIDAIESKLLENSPQADAYLRRLTALFFADLERLNRLIPLMKAHLDKDEMIKLHELLETAAKHSQPPGWFPFWKK
jgi:hypothetical protein